jgi:methionyl aminopeptidase
MISIKSLADIETLTEGGKISKKILDEALRKCVPGKVLAEIDREIGEMMAENDVEPWFPEVDDYPANSCISVNDVWLHGIPGDQVLKQGDVASVDIGIKYKGLYLDNCWTVVVNPENATRSDIRAAYQGAGDEVEAFLKAGEMAVFKAIEQAIPGKRTGDISAAMQINAESNGYSVIRDFAGHGVGHDSHEDPQILCYGTPGAGPVLRQSMVLAIEIMYTMGNPKIDTAEDGWGIVTADGAISGMFEHTVAVTPNGPKILTN